MFWKRRPPHKPPAPEDPDLAQAQARLAERQEAVATLQLDLFNSRADLARFAAEVEARLGELQRRLEAVEAAVVEARQQASRRARWGDRADSPTMPDDIIVQYERLWGRKAASAAPARPATPQAPPAHVEAELKTLYRHLAKRLHPDLASSPDEKTWREDLMARANQAYQAHDLKALQELAKTPEWRGSAGTKTTAEVLAEVQAQIGRLDELAADLERELDQLAQTPLVQLKLDVAMAGRRGADLLGEMADELADRIVAAEEELHKLKP